MLSIRNAVDQNELPPRLRRAAPAAGRMSFTVLGLEAVAIPALCCGRPMYPLGELRA